MAAVHVPDTVIKINMNVKTEYGVLQMTAGDECK